MIAVIWHFWSSYWVCGSEYSLVMFRFLSLLKWDWGRDELERVMKQTEGEKRRWPRVISLSQQHWMPVHWGTLGLFPNPGMGSSLTSDSSVSHITDNFWFLNRGCWDFIFMNIIFHKVPFSFKLIITFTVTPKILLSAHEKVLFGVERIVNGKPVRWRCTNFQSITNTCNSQ